MTMKTRIIRKRDLTDAMECANLYDYETADTDVPIGEEWQFMHGWLVRAAEGCTCDMSGDAHYPHRDYCGFEPVIRRERLDQVAVVLAAARAWDDAWRMGTAGPVEGTALHNAIVELDDPRTVSS